MDNPWIIYGKFMENSWIIHAKEILFIYHYFHEADNLLSAEFMQTKSVWSFLPRYRFKHTISFSGISLFYHNIFLNMLLFTKYICFRNCFCKTNLLQELFLWNKSFSGIVSSNIVLLRNCLLRCCPSQELSSQVLSFSGTVFSDIVLLRNCLLRHCYEKSSSYSWKLKIFFIIFAKFYKTFCNIY